MDNNAEPFDEGKNEGAEFGFKYDGEDDGFADDGRAMNYEDGGAGVENDDDDDDGSIFSDEDDLSDEEQDMDNEALPAFANAENRALNKDVEAHEKKREILTKGVIENADRVKIMKEHLKNVRQEVTHTQGLVEAKASECRSEDHLKALAERAVGGVRGRIQKYKIERDELQDRLNTVQNTIFKGNEKMDRFKLQMNWNQEELEQWALAAKQKEEDNLALQKYTRADESKIKELNLQIEKLTTLVAEKKQELEEEMTETQAKQVELDKTAADFRALHAERQKLIAQWQASIETMKVRDREIAEAGERFAKAKLVVEQAQEVLQKEQERLRLEEQKTVSKEAAPPLSLLPGLEHSMWSECGASEPHYAVQEFQDG